jgi:6-pyruvoyltetrahydropterin/6-carboxytetrahydropterin synthase
MTTISTPDAGEAATTVSADVAAEAEATARTEVAARPEEAAEPAPRPQPRVTVVRHEHFNAAHRLHNPALSDEENRRLFGKCNSPNHHGHNYELAVRITGPIDPRTGYVIDLGALSSLVEHEVLDRFDHRNLNLDVDLFATLNPTAEHIAVTIYELLRPRVEPHLDLHVTLHETPRNAVEYPGRS